MKRPRKAKKLPVIKPDPNMAYQWAGTHRESMHELQRYLDAGWTVSKHPAQQAKNVPREVVLLEIPREQHRQMVAADIERAKKQMREVRELFQMNSSYRGEGKRFPLVSDSFMVSSAYETVPSDTLPIDVPVTINFRLSGRFQDAAASLGLPATVYAQRRIELYLSGALGGLLLPVDQRAGDLALELHETGAFALTPRI